MVAGDKNAFNKKETERREIISLGIKVCSVRSFPFPHPLIVFIPIFLTIFSLSYLLWLYLSQPPPFLFLSFSHSSSCFSHCPFFSIYFPFVCLIFAISLWLLSHLFLPTSLLSVYLSVVSVSFHLFLLISIAIQMRIVVLFVTLTTLWSLYSSFHQLFFFLIF